MRPTLSFALAAALLIARTPAALAGPVKRDNPQINTSLNGCTIATVDYQNPSSTLAGLESTPPTVTPPVGISPEVLRDLLRLCIATANGDTFGATTISNVLGLIPVPNGQGGVFDIPNGVSPSRSGSLGPVNGGIGSDLYPLDHFLRLGLGGTDGQGDGVASDQGAGSGSAGAGEQVYGLLGSDVQRIQAGNGASSGGGSSSGGNNGGNGGGNNGGHGGGNNGGHGGGNNGGHGGGNNGGNNGNNNGGNNGNNNGGSNGSNSGGSNNGGSNGSNGNNNIGPAQAVTNAINCSSGDLVDIGTQGQAEGVGSGACISV